MAAGCILNNLGSPKLKSRFRGDGRSMDKSGGPRATIGLSPEGASRSGRRRYIAVGHELIELRARRT